MMTSTATDAVEQINMETEFEAHVGKDSGHFAVSLDGDVCAGMSRVGEIANKYGFKFSGVVYETVYFHKI